MEETAAPVIPFVPAEPEAVEEQPETQYMPMEAVPAAPAMQEESELEVPEEPDHEYIDEIIRRMAQKQAAARSRIGKNPRLHRQYSPLWKRRRHRPPCRPRHRFGNRRRQLPR